MPGKLRFWRKKQFPLPSLSVSPKPPPLPTISSSPPSGPGPVTACERRKLQGDEELYYVWSESPLMREIEAIEAAAAAEAAATEAARAAMKLHLERMETDEEYREQEARKWTAGAAALRKATANQRGGFMFDHKAREEMWARRDREAAARAARVANKTS
ncbi:hypothetical protein BU16DRAFT_538946 [Lophium mytilinum]|uniref:Uncharacterized protein n=1 Tax=Lophium mytilinum TaxID=390894 RepID=A0A6A6QVI4_9PEZI|nr:hypothetical protein BU16DRAFT_538946 [Lophium mytilinum]